MIGLLRDSRAGRPDAADRVVVGLGVPYGHGVSEASIAFLKAVPLLSEVTEHDLRELAPALRRREFALGRTLTDEGEGGIGFFIIESGSAAVSQAGRPVATLGPGDYFGEVSLLAESDRSATVVTASVLVCWVMTAWDFRPFVSRQPSVALKLLEGLARQVAR